MPNWLEDSDAYHWGSKPQVAVKQQNNLKKDKENKKIKRMLLDLSRISSGRDILFVKGLRKWLDKEQKK